jgi:hypothetical protein
LDELLARSPTRNDALWSDALEARQFSHALAGLLLAESRPDRRTQTPVKLDSQHALRRYWLWAFLMYEGLAKQLPYRLSHWYCAAICMRIACNISLMRRSNYEQ